MRRGVIAVCAENHTKRTSTMRGQKAEFVDFLLDVACGVVTTGLQRVFREALE